MSENALSNVYTPTIAKLKYAYLNVGTLSAEEMRSILREAIQALREADAAPLLEKIPEVIDGEGGLRVAHTDEEQDDDVKTDK